MLFWTFILNAICKAGYKEVSWFMVLLPIILLFIIIGIVILNSGSVSIYEGFKEGIDGDDGAGGATENPTTFSCSILAVEASCNNYTETEGCKWNNSTNKCEKSSGSNTGSSSESDSTE